MKEKQDQLRWRQRRIDEAMKRFQLVKAEESQIMKEYAEVSVLYDQACELSESDGEDDEKENKGKEQQQAAEANADLNQMMHIVESFEEDNSTQNNDAPVK